MEFASLKGSVLATILPHNRVTSRGSVTKHVVIVGSGLAGLAASVFLARSGRSVTVFEKRRQLGGRAVTHLRQGYRFNLGPHAFYRGGAGARVLRELGVPVRGGVPPGTGIAMAGSERHRLPGSFWSFLATRLLSPRAKLGFAAILWRLRRLDMKALQARTLASWLDENVTDAGLRAFLVALIRLATYSARAEDLSAGAALAQLRVALKRVIYVDEGWQKIVDSLHSSAVAAGVNFVTTSRIVGVHHDGAVRSIELGGLEVEPKSGTLQVALPDARPDEVDGARLPAETVVLAVDPVAASELVPELGSGIYSPVTAACLDVALSRLPEPRNLFALGIDKPLYYSVHSQWAQLTPRGGALVHAMKYRQAPAIVTGDELEGNAPVRPDVLADQQELELLLDEMQPGWREVLVHRRFLPSMTVSNALVTPHTHRPSPVTAIKGLYLAGDWVGDEGMLSDASLASAAAAAKAIIAAG